MDTAAEGVGVDAQRVTARGFDRRDLALALLRLIMGVVFIAHGAQKLFGSFGGGGLDGTAAGMARNGLEPGMLFAVLAGILEFVGGLLLLVGLFLPLAGAAVIVVMIGAIAVQTGSGGFFIQRQGYEYNLTLIVAAVALALAGPGRLSLHHRLGRGQRD